MNTQDAPPTAQDRLAVTSAAVDNQPAPRDGLIQPEANAHAFIVRIWKDATDERGQATAWHGSIDHVGSRSRLYFHKLSSILEFIRERSEINGEFGRSWRHRITSRVQGVFSRSR
ncbi:MAG: hypothetical protein JXA78_11840 [Anaerolineales bacterium]|nr:hypothetical protein [Anaerolineales bacterium]